VIIVFDAAGLGLFAVAGAAKALDFGIHPFIAVLMGGVTGVGGGTVRDVLLARIPTVLRADVYATAALAGAAVLVLGLSLKMNLKLMTILGAATVSHCEWSAFGATGTCLDCSCTDNLILLSFREEKRHPVISSEPSQRGISRFFESYEP
jgi:uncharacterized membrane protein YeiH